MTSPDGYGPKIVRQVKTKGNVESGVKYIKRSFLPGRCFRDIEDFNDLGDAAAGRPVEVVTVLHKPAGRHELRVDVLLGFLVRGPGYDLNATLPGETARNRLASSACLAVG